MKDSAVVILAAGESARMGEPKQLLTFKGTTFINYAIETAWPVFNNRICVVLGAQANLILQNIPKLADICAINNNWKQGMGTSIAFGLQTVINRYPGLSSVVFMTVDQPFVTGNHLTEMLRVYHTTGKKIIASSYQDVTGIPALFDASYFTMLLKLHDDKGARNIIRDSASDVEAINLSDGETDIDTPEQYQQLIKQVAGKKPQ